jgi:DNA-binding LacI/PurR family transcriptional regulator
MRLRGYLDALTDAGIEADPALIAVARLWHRAEGENAARQLLARQAEVDAIFCFNDALALGAMRALQSSGVRIPEDIALVGFDDVEDARYSTPSLTTVSPGRDQIASNAVAMLIARIEGDEMGEAPVHVEADFQLVVRESSGGVTGATRPGPPRP